MEEITQTIIVTDTEANRIIKALKDRIDLYDIALKFVPCDKIEGIEDDKALLYRLISKINSQLI